MYVYLVVLMLNGSYSVQAPNIVFKTLEDCLSAKAANAQVLNRTKPFPNARYYSTCIQIPKDVEA